MRMKNPTLRKGAEGGRGADSLGWSRSGEKSNQQFILRVQNWDTPYTAPATPRIGIAWGGLPSPAPTGQSRGGPRSRRLCKALRLRSGQALGEPEPTLHVPPSHTYPPYFFTP